MSAKYSLLDFQLDETSSDTEWKWNIVSEELDRKIETIYTVSEERLNKAGPMIWMVLTLPNKRRNDTLQHNKEDKDTSITR